MGTFKTIEEAREFFKKDTFASANGMVIDESGLVIAHHDETKKGKNIATDEEGKALFNAIKSADSGDFIFEYDGKENTVFVNHIINGFSVAMVVDNSELYGSVRNQLFVTIVICTMITILIVIFFFVARKITLFRLCGTP